MSANLDTESTSADTRRIYDALPDGWHSREFAAGFAEGLLACTRQGASARVGKLLRDGYLAQRKNGDVCKVQA